jgi:hypothetical protein
MVSKPLQSYAPFVSKYEGLKVDDLLLAEQKEWNTKNLQHSVISISAA